MQKTNSIQINPKRSDVEKTFTLPCSLSRLSLDHRGQPKKIANATYSVSFLSGQIFCASCMNCLNFENGTNLTCANISSLASSKSCFDNPDFERISLRCFVNSSPKNSGAKSMSLSENSNSAVLPPEEIRV